MSEEWSLVEYGIEGWNRGKTTVGISQRGHKEIELKVKIKLLVFNRRKTITSETIGKDKRMLVVQIIITVSEVRN